MTFIRSRTSPQPIGNFQNKEDTVVNYNFRGNLADESGNALDLSVSAGEISYCDIWPGSTAAILSTSTTLTRAANSAFQLTGEMTIHLIMAIEARPAGELLLILSGSSGTDSDPNNNTVYQLSLEPATEPNVRMQYFSEFSGGNNQSFDQSGDPTESISPPFTPMMLSMVRGADNQVTFYQNGTLSGSTSVGMVAPTGGSNGILTTSTGEVIRIYKGLTIRSVAESPAEVLNTYNETLGLAFGPLV